MIMRDTVFTLSEGADEDTIRQSVKDMVADVQKYRRLENGNTIRLTLYKSNRATRPATSDQPSPPLATDPAQ